MSERRTDKITLRKQEEGPRLKEHEPFTQVGFDKGDGRRFRLERQLVS